MRKRFILRAEILLSFEMKQKNNKWNFVIVVIYVTVTILVFLIKIFINFFQVIKIVDFQDVTGTVLKRFKLSKYNKLKCGKLSKFFNSEFRK